MSGQERPAILKFANMNAIDPNLVLTRMDLPALEKTLSRNLETFFAFSDFALFFPREGDKPEILHLTSENKLFLPLVWRGEFLATLMLNGVKNAEIKKLFPFLERVASACLKIVALEKFASADAATGLSAEGALFSHIEREVETLREILADPTQTSRPFHRVCFGLCVLVWHDAPAIARDYDVGFRESVFERLASTLRANLPAAAIAAPLGRFDGKHEFGIILPASGGKACHKFVEHALNEFEKTEFIEPLSKKRVPAVLYGGHALYPQDMHGDELRAPVFEQIVRLKERARLGARAARAAGERIMAFGDVLRKGGGIIAREREGVVRVNLGSLANAREGMRFRAIDTDGVETGEIILTRVRPRDSVAEIIYVAQAGKPPLPGCSLIPVLPGKTGEITAPPGTRGHDVERAEFRGHAEFLASFAEGARACSLFTLAVCKFANSESAETKVAAEKFFAETEALVYGVEKAPGAPALAAKHGDNGLIFFHPGAGVAEVRNFYERLTGAAERNGLKFACGLFEWPFLNYAKNSADTCAFKALEYAWLLPEPRIGVFDSLALNISADVYYSRGDAYKAREEYELALLADPGNQLARNSLGVCLAAMGKFDEAVTRFREALEASDDNALKAKISYNLGAVYQKLKDDKSARAHYRRSLKFDENHVYSHLKLGRLYENRGKIADARKLYERALELSAGDEETRAVAGRYLARLETSAKENRKARSRLHDLLVRNPEDAASMTLLAKIYLQNRDDPELAEFLARKSASLTDSPEAWRALAEALAAQGKGEEAGAARERANKKFGDA